MTDEEKRARIAELRRKLARRRGIVGFESNARAIEEEIANLEAQ